MRKERDLEMKEYVLLILYYFFEWDIYGVMVNALTAIAGTTMGFTWCGGDSQENSSFVSCSVLENLSLLEPSWQKKKVGPERSPMK